MRGDPGPTTYTADGRDHIYAFARGDDNRLYACIWNASVGLWQWSDRGVPPSARVDSSPAAIASLQMDTPPMPFLHAFVKGNNGRLFEHVWNGSRWSWIDHGQPYWNAAVVSTPAPVAFRRTRQRGGEIVADASDQLYVFCWGSDDTLYRFSQDAGQWLPAGRLPNPTQHVASEPDAIAQGIEFVHVNANAYLVGSDGRLYTHHSVNEMATDWMWRDLGQPADAITVTRNIRPALASLGDQLYAFVRGSEGNLWAHSWQGWRRKGPLVWTDLGAPPGTTVSGHSSVVTYNHEGTTYMYVFVRGADERLYVHRWNGTDNRLWAGLGRPTTGGNDVPASPSAGHALVLSAPGAVTARFESTRRIYAFVRANDNNLHVCFWNGVDRWFWTDLGEPSLPPAQISFHPASINFGSTSLMATKTRTLTIENASAVPVTLSIPGSGPGVFQWPVLNVVLAPGDQRALVVEFTPARPVEETEILRGTSNAAGSPHSVGLKGNGIGTTPV